MLLSGLTIAQSEVKGYLRARIDGMQDNRKEQQRSDCMAIFVLKGK